MRILVPLLVLSLVLLSYGGAWYYIIFIYPIHQFQDTLARAEQGDAEAQATVGKLYTADKCALKIPAPCDPTAGEEWLLKAAKQGNVRGQFWLGLAYKYDRGIKMDPDKAVKWLRAAAEQGYQPAQEALGQFYLATEHQCMRNDGRSWRECDAILPKPDYEEGYFWLSISLPKTFTICRRTSHLFWSSDDGCTTSPDIYSAQQIAKAAANLTSKQKTAVDKRVATWQKKHPALSPK